MSSDAVVQAVDKDRNIIVNSWVKRGEVMSLPFSAFSNAPNYSMWSYLNPSMYVKIKSEINTNTCINKAKHYFRLEIFVKQNGDKGGNLLIGSIDVIAKIKYNSYRSEGLVEHVSSKELWGQFRISCPH